MRNQVFTSALICVSLFGIITAPVSAQPTGYEGYQIVRISTTDDGCRAAVESLLRANGDITLESETIGPVFVDLRLPPGASVLLDTLGLRHEVRIKDLQEEINKLYGVGAADRGGDFFDYLRTYDEHVVFMQTLAATYPDLVEMFSLGDSVEGRALWALKITGAEGENKPAVFYQAAQHGNEQSGASVLEYVAQHLVMSYETDPDMRWMVDNLEVYLLPISNPDGYVIGQRYNAHRVDTNRNWGGPGAGFSTSTDPGPHTFSEPETAAFRDFFENHSNIRVYFDLHGYANYILWPWGYQSPRCLDHRTYRILGVEMRDIILAAGGISYLTGQGYRRLYPVSGGSKDYAYGVHGAFSFVFEIDDSYPPYAIQYADPVLLKMLAWSIDCNENGAPDWADIAQGVSEDCNGNRVPDECESPDDCDQDGETNLCAYMDSDWPDCNGNAVPDECDIANGTSEDVNGDGLPDECEDCNHNHIHDYTDINGATSLDCNANSVPDECDVASGVSEDCNQDGIPDECQLDGIGAINLEQTIQELNLHQEEIAGLIPDLYLFTEGETGYEIADGAGLYQGGNRLNTDLAQMIPYTNGQIVSSDAEFGPGSRYLTIKYPGLFVMIASGMRVQWFGIDGRLSERDYEYSYFNESGSPITVNGVAYKYCYKQILGSPLPKLYHIMAVRSPASTSLSHRCYSHTPMEDTDTLFWTYGSSEIVYLMFAGASLEDGYNPIVENLLACIVWERYHDFNANGIPDECDCLGDLNGDGIVDLDDLANMLSHYGQSGVTYYDGDLNGDGTINLDDLAELLCRYGDVCE